MNNVPRLIDHAVMLKDGTVIVGRHSGHMEFGAINGTVDQFGKFRDNAESVKAVKAYIEHASAQQKLERPMLGK